MLKYLFIILCLPIAALAQNLEYGGVKLLKGWQEQNGRYQIALEFKLNEGWKTYWRTPGPAGLAPEFVWDGSDNIGNVVYQWPTPEIIRQGGMTTLGYHNTFVLPIEITPVKKGPVRLAMTLNFGVCSEICVPAQAVFLARLDGSADDGVELIQAALDDQPQTRDASGLEHIECAVVRQEHGYEMTADLDFAEAIETPMTVIEYSSPEIWFDLAESRSNGGAISAIAPLKYYGTGEMNLDMHDVTVSVFGANRAVEITSCAG